MALYKYQDCFNCEILHFSWSLKQENYLLFLTHHFNRLRMSTSVLPTAPIYIVSVNNTPEVAKMLVHILIKVMITCYY